MLEKRPKLKVKQIFHLILTEQKKINASNQTLGSKAFTD
jgi:hypothetical protein